jgi:hypothetical protein
MLKSEQKAYERILSWSDRNNYFDDVYRTLLQTGIVFVCRNDLFEVVQRLEKLGISITSLEIVSSYGGYSVKMRDHHTRKKRGVASTNPKVLKLRDYYNKHG